MLRRIKYSILIFILLILIIDAGSEQIESKTITLNSETIHKVEFNYSEIFSLKLVGTVSNKISLLILNKIEYLNFLNQNKYDSIYNNTLLNNFDLTLKIDEINNKTICILFINNNNESVQLSYQIQVIKVTSKFLDNDIFSLILSGILIILLKKKKQIN